MPTDARPDDAELVLAAQQGDRDAFGTLVARHAPSVLSVTRRMVGAAADADDVAQDVFVAAFKALGSFKAESKFSTWLYRIAVNKCTDWLRARRLDLFPLGTADDDGVDSWEPPDFDTPYSELAQAELATEIDRSIGALPPLYREAFILRHVEGLDYDEMSTILGVARDTLKMRVYKARTRLCQHLAHLEGVCR
jgi:RNA polymerase sigma-70 factor, ECF subfamily